MVFSKKDFPIIDSHCHPFPQKREKTFEQYWMMSLAAQSPFHSTRTISFQMVKKELIRLFNLPESTSWNCVLENRNERYRNDPDGYVHDLLSDAGIRALLVDFGFPIRGARLTDEENAEFYERTEGVYIGRINRIENITNSLLLEKLSYSDFISRFNETATKMVIDEKLIAMKSVIAYYTGLGIKRKKESEVEMAYYKYLNDPNDVVSEKQIRDEIFFKGLEICKAQGIPMQVHSGMGDAPVCDLRKTNPILLHDAFNETIAQETTIVLDHCGYPFIGETGYFASHFENLYIDISSMIPHAAHAGETKILELLEMCPWTRIMHGSDGGSIPEHMWLAALYIRDALGRSLDYLVEKNFISSLEAEEIARMILYQNAERVYKLKCA